mgnify:CR=1 FL=1
MKDKNKKKDILNDVVVKTSKDITGKQTLLMIPLTKFFCQKKNIDILLNILDGKSKISLRLIDWFVTNYSKKYNVVYNKNDYDSSKKKIKKENYSFNDFFIVYNDYKSQLKEVSKKHFDPFCRRQRIHFYYTKEKFILTTVGQLNFFKWAIENNILQYIEENIKDIELDMNSNTKGNKKIVNDNSCKDNLTNDKNFTKKKSDIIHTCENKNSIKKNQNNKKNKSQKDSGKDIKELKNKDLKVDKSKKNIVINKKKTTQRKKRKELSESASKSIIKYHYPITIEFD